MKETQTGIKYLENDDYMFRAVTVTKEHAELLEVLCHETLQLHDRVNALEKELIKLKIGGNHAKIKFTHNTRLSLGVSYETL